MKKTLIAVALLAISTPSTSATDVKLSRYSIVNPDVNYDQKNPLETVIDIKIPPSVKTVEGAIKYVLTRSGYTLLPVSKSDPEIKITYKKELPYVHRQFKMVTVRNAIAALAGKPYTLVVDPIRREVTFDSEIKIGGVM
ncbi:hypothetical protein [Motilimonas cestriensis]|uniref:PFGI-1 class ICE element type IV pilus protein PilL2 n=1 Tax=Motilimonas cestriensis TaxID=2742685 RepID=UPI003DA40424